MSCDVLYCHELSSVVKRCVRTIRTTKYYSVLQEPLQHYSVLQSTTLHYNVLLQYHPVLQKEYFSIPQSPTPVLHCATKYYSVLQSTTPVLLQYYSLLQSTTKYYSVLQSTSPYYKVLLQYYSVLQSNTYDPSNITKCCVCHTK